MKSTLTVYVLLLIMAIALIGCVILAIRVGNLRRDLGTDKASIKREQKLSKQRLDSVRRLQEKADVENQVLVFKYESSLKELQRQHAITNRVRKEYEKAKNTRLPVMSDVQLDSVVTVIVGLHH